MTTQTKALKMALEALENHSGNYKLSKAECAKHEIIIAAIKEALAQPKEQEPVAWISQSAGFIAHNKPDQSLNPLPLYLAPPPCPTCEALAQTVMLDQTSHDTTPPQRKPMTYDEIEDLYFKFSMGELKDFPAPLKTPTELRSKT